MEKQTILEIRALLVEIEGKARAGLPYNYDEVLRLSEEAPGARTAVRQAMDRIEKGTTRRVGGRGHKRVR
jgi:hypothetical protein